MTHPELKPGDEAASPTALGKLFRITSLWLQENGAIGIGQILSPSRGDDQAPIYEFDGDVIRDLLPEAAATLDIRPGSEFSCGFWPSYVEPAIDDDETDTLEPAECTFTVKYKDDPLVGHLDRTIYLDDTDSGDEWLGRGETKVEHHRSRNEDMTPEQRFLRHLEALALSDLVATPITVNECGALQQVADNLDRLKAAQEAR